MTAPRRSVPPPAPTVLLVDDEQELLELLAMRLEHSGYRTERAATAREALARFAKGGLDAVVLDLKLPDSDGLTVLAQMRDRAPDVPVLMLTAHGTIETAVEAMRRGAYGFLTKPFHHHELLQSLAHAVERASLRREVAGLRRIVGSPDEGHLLGTSPTLTAVREIIERIAPTDVTVLITGESGTGKELCARSLHSRSLRTSGPFVAINCAAIPADLLESELFGHVKGAFTGASRDREGLFSAASGGTLFLDEVGDAAPNVQAKLLRVLQERRYTPVGSTQEREADVRVVAATNRDLRADVSRGRFREDLFFRLHVVPVEMPPLRDRGEDISLLAELFLERASARHGMAVPSMSGAALTWMMGYAWPGNVRELANVMEGALLLSGGGELTLEVLQRLAASAPSPRPAAVSIPSEEAATTDATTGIDPVLTLTDATRPLPPLRDARDAFERAYLVEVLRRANGSVAAAARVAGRNRTDFYDLLRRHSVKWRGNDS